MKNIFEVYRVAESDYEIAQFMAEYLKNEVNCQTVSIFIFNEITKKLSLLYTTSKKVEKVIKQFGQGTSIYYMIEKEDGGIISSDKITSDFPKTDIFFEDIKEVFSIAFAIAKDCYNKPLAVVRLLNKLGGDGTLIEFIQGDLETIVAAANIFGVSVVARYAHQRAISFLDSVTHELLAPMSAAKNTAIFLKGYVNKMTEEREEERKSRILDNLNDVQKFAETSISLVQGITMFSRSGRMSKRDLEIKPCHLFKDVIAKSIGSVSAFIASRKFKRDKIRALDYHKWPLFKVDRKIMEQVFSNLFVNSIKYAYDDPGIFSIDIVLEIRASGDAIIKIRDFGIGVEKEEAERIFLPGERGDKARAKIPTGTGIGLTTVKHLLELHGMSIELSNYSMPTEFSIKIPIDYVIRSRT